MHSSLYVGIVCNLTERRKVPLYVFFEVKDLIERLVDRYVTKLKKNALILEKQEEIIKFGICEIIYFVLEMFLLLGIAIFMRQFLGGILILLTFMPVRIYAGGVHEETRLKCIVRTSILYLVLLYCLKYNVIPEYIRIVVMIITSVLLWKFAPIQSQNNKLDEKQVIIYRRRAIIFWCIECILFIVGFLCQQYYVANAISLGMCMLFYVLLFAVI